MISDLSGLDVAALRADTPGCGELSAGGQARVHLNNAGSALPAGIVTDTVVRHLRLEERIGGYEAAAMAATEINAVYTSVGALVGSGPESIALTTSATDSWLRAFLAVPLVPGDRVLISASEYASNVLPLLQAARRKSVVVQTVPDDQSGALDVDAFTSLLGPDVRLVAITHAPSQNGLINPVAAIGAALHRSGSDAWYLVDACQSVGQMPLDANAIGCDFLSATGRKFLRGPRGTGFLWASERALTLEPGFLDLHAAEWTELNDYVLATGARRYESWEKPIAALLGLGAAVDVALGVGLERIEQRITAVAAEARTRLGSVPNVTIRDRGMQRSGIVTFTVDGRDAADVVASLTSQGVAVSLSTPDYSLRDFRSQGIDGLVRVSPHVFTTDDDLDRLISVVSAIA